MTNARSMTGRHAIHLDRRPVRRVRRGRQHLRQLPRRRSAFDPRAGRARRRNHRGRRSDVAVLRNIDQRAAGRARHRSRSRSGASPTAACRRTSSCSSSARPTSSSPCRSRCRCATRRSSCAAALTATVVVKKRTPSHRDRREHRHLAVGDTIERVSLVVLRFVSKAVITELVEA